MPTKATKNPDMVKTISGKLTEKDKVCLIDKEYHEKHIECIPILIDGKEKWFKLTNPDIGFNLIDNCWDLVSNLLNKGMRRYLTSFEKGNTKKPVFQWAFSNSLLDVNVKSHYSCLADDLIRYQKELINCENSILGKKENLKDSNLFEKYYGSFITFMSKLAYYRQVMEKEYDINESKPKDFFKIIVEVDSFISSDPALSETFRDFDRCYKIYTDKRESVIEESELEKITFELLEKEPILAKVFEIFLTYIGARKSVQSEILLLENKINEYKKGIKTISEKGYFNETCLTKKDAFNMGFTDSNKSDILYLKSNLNNDEYLVLKNSYPVFSEGVYKNLKINYNAASNTDTFNQILRNYHALSDTRTFTKDSYKIAKLLKGLSLGIEFETSCGRLREQDLSSLGLIPLRDGSIKGFEFTTIPYGMKDERLAEKDTIMLAKDLVTLQEVCKELTSKTKINNFCSMHLHIGGNRTDKLYLIALYMLSYKIQDDIFKTQPKFKEDGPKYLGTQKNYCQKLDHLGLFDNCIFDKSSILKESYCDNVNMHFNNIFKFLSGGFDIGSKYNRKNHKHPYERKWERNARYHWINLVNCVFSNSGTIEFRVHNPTTNFTKVLNWILICAAIVKYADTHTKEIVSGKIKDFSLNTILLGYSNGFRDKKRVDSFGLFIYNYLSSYIRERSTYFALETSKEKYLGEDDVNKDASYEFNFNGIKSLM